MKKSIVCTFLNHPPIRLHGEFDDENGGRYVHNYEDGRLWDGNQDFGHHEINWYVCKSGKRIYWASYNSGYQRNGREPETTRIFLKTAKDIENYFIERDMAREWNRVGHLVDPAVIVDSDLL